MATIEPFASIHYNSEAIEDISKVVCPPYDVIDPRGQEECYQRHPYNIVRLILGKDFAGDKAEENRYTRAAVYIEDWLRRGILVQDKEPSIYFYEQIFSLEGRKKRRAGFIALMRLEEEGETKSIYPHEHTDIAPKEDRFKLIKSVEANLSPIFTVFSDRDAVFRGIFEEIAGHETPFLEAMEERNIENRVWRISSKPLIDKVKAFLAEKEIFIADGHHRYEVAKMFRDHKRQQDAAHFKDSYNYIMTYFTPLEDDGLCILPIHRIIKNARFSPQDFSQCFTVKELSSQESLCSEMKEKEGQVGVFGLYANKKFYLLKLTDKRECNRFIQDGPKEYKNLDVVILHKVVLDHILKINPASVRYEVNLREAIKRVDEATADALFILNPTKIDQIRSIALSGEVMPQKSTYFYPKLLSGLLIHKF